MNKDLWFKWEKDPENPEYQIAFRKAAIHVIKESEQLYSHLEQWILNQSQFSAGDIEWIRKLDEFNDQINDSLLGGLLISRNFVGITDQASLIKGTKAEQIMKKHGWRVLDIQGPVYRLDQKELFQLTIAILEAADQGLSESTGYRLQKESRGLLAFRDQKGDQH